MTWQTCEKCGVTQPSTRIGHHVCVGGASPDPGVIRAATDEESKLAERRRR